MVHGESPGGHSIAMALDFGGQFLPVVPGDFFHHAHLAPCRNEDRFECGETRSVKNHRVIDVTSIVIDVTSMESLHKLMVFPSHTMYSSLCHVPNRAQTGPKQLRKLTLQHNYPRIDRETALLQPELEKGWKWIFADKRISQNHATSSSNTMCKGSS